MKAILLGNKPVTEALGKVLRLFDIALDPINNYDIFIMVDGETAQADVISAIKPIGNEKVIYLESNNKNTEKHSLFYLTFLLQTYRIPLEQFSIVALAKIINDIKREGSK